MKCDPKIKIITLKSQAPSSKFYSQLGIMNQKRPFDSSLKSSEMEKKEESSQSSPGNFLIQGKRQTAPAGETGDLEDFSYQDVEDKYNG